MRTAEFAKAVKCSLLYVTDVLPNYISDIVELIVAKDNLEVFHAL